MHAQSLRRVRQNLMLAPSVGNAAGECDHPPQYIDLFVECLSLNGWHRGGLKSKLFDKLAALFRQNFYRIGRQQLIVAECCRDRVTVLTVFEPGLNVVTSVAGRLESINPDDLILGQ